MHTIFPYLEVVRTPFVSKMSQFVIIRVKSNCYVLFCRPNLKNIGEVLWIAEKGLHVIPAHTYQLHKTMRRQVSPLFSVIVAWNTYLFVSYNLTYMVTVLLKKMQKFYNLQPFVIMVGETLWSVHVAHVFLSPSPVNSPVSTAGSFDVQ